MLPLFSTTSDCNSERAKINRSFSRRLSYVQLSKSTRQTALLKAMLLGWGRAQCLSIQGAKRIRGLCQHPSG